MKIKTFFIVMLFLSGIAVQFASAMEQKLELVCYGRIASLNILDYKTIQYTVNYPDAQHVSKPYEKEWIFGQAKQGDSSEGGLAEVKIQNSAAPSYPIIMSQVANNHLFTVSYNGQKQESYIRYKLISEDIQIKMRHDQQKKIYAIDKNLGTCCMSETLLSTLADEQQCNQEISLDLTQDQFETAWNHMQLLAINIVTKISTYSHSYTVKQLCDLIVGDSVLRIKTDGEYNLQRDCLNVIKAKFNECKFDGARGEYFAQVECLPSFYQSIIALHIAKDFIGQNKYPFVDLDDYLLSKSKTKIQRGKLSISRGYDNARSTIIISIETDNSGLLYDLYNKPQHVHTLGHSSGEVQEVAISKEVDKFRLPAHVVTLAGGKVTLWSSTNGNEPFYWYTILNPEDNDDHIISIDITGDGKFVAAATYNGHLRIWDVETGSCFVILQHPFDTTDQIMFGENGNESCIYYRVQGSGDDRIIDLKNLFQRVGFVKNSGVRTAYFVNKLEERLSSQGSITLTQVEHDELNTSLYKEAIETFFYIDPTKIVEIKQPVQSSVDMTIKNSAPEKSPFIDQKKPDENGKQSSFFTFKNFMKYAALPACVIGMLCLIFHTMHH